MPKLNYSHLRYFWMAAREGGVTRASEKLGVSQPSITTQIHDLERTLGERLFSRSGRRLVLTDVGRLVYRYSEEIFNLGQEMLESLEGRATGRPARLTVGVAKVVPKLVAFRLLEPALRLPEPVLVECREDTVERLLAELATHSIDIVLADAPVPSTVHIRAFAHLLGECGVGVFGASELATRARRRFPTSLDGAPFLVPSQNTALRRSLETWFESRRLRPMIVGEFEDSALLKVFGEAGAGLFAAPLAIADDIRRRYGVRLVGELEGVKERFYAISVERRLAHPAVIAISEGARRELFTPLTRRRPRAAQP
jgi:LysR family transcriptional regulator, transcriptional activator of nhaA